MAYDRKRTKLVTKLPKLSWEASRFIKSLRDKCRYHNVNLILSDTPQVWESDDDLIGGSAYFKVDPWGHGASIVCSVYGPESDWLPLLVHESCHMDQWIEDPQNWYRSEKSMNRFFSWQNSEIKLSQKKIKSDCRKIQLLELDCERRSIDKITQWGLEIDLKSYIQKANSCLLSYLYVAKTGNHFPDWSLSKIWRKMPKKLIWNPSHLPKWIEREWDRRV